MIWFLPCKCAIQHPIHLGCLPLKRMQGNCPIRRRQLCEICERNKFSVSLSIISTAEGPSLRVKSFAVIDLRTWVLPQNRFIYHYYLLVFIFRKLMFWLVDLYHVSFFYMTTTHGCAVILCMNFLLHGKDGRMLKLLKVDLREDCKANFRGNVLKG